MIRLALAEDAAAIQAIYAPNVEKTAISFETEVPSVAEMAARIGKTLPHWPWLVDEKDGAIRGYVYAGQHRTRAAYRWSVDTTAYVAEYAQGQGVGKRLYQVLFELLRAQGYTRAFAGITEPNAASQALHRSAGFVPVGVYGQVGYKLGAWHDVGWWQLDLGSPPGIPPEPVPLDALNLPEAWV
ncbi:MAG: N-acetyltransferase [Alphaproteobacteria bacterium]|nr:N-acetyltransferase [Alphaproteobacteria bacterium]